MLPELCFLSADYGRTCIASDIENVRVCTTEPEKLALIKHALSLDLMPIFVPVRVAFAGNDLLEAVNLAEEYCESKGMTDGSGTPGNEIRLVVALATSRLKANGEH